MAPPYVQVQNESNIKYWVSFISQDLMRSILMILWIAVRRLTVIFRSQSRSQGIRWQKLHFALKCDRCLGRAGIEMPVKFQSVCKIINSSVAFSNHHDTFVLRVHMALWIVLRCDARWHAVAWINRYSDWLVSLRGPVLTPLGRG